MLPKISNSNLNKNIKKLFEFIGWTNPCIKTRERRGIAVRVYKNVKTKEHFRFCDMITSHTMRRTAITTMLCLGMPELAVRKISGHAANSKEFFKYVALSQIYMDNEVENVYEQLKKKVLVTDEIYV